MINPSFSLTERIIIDSIAYQRTEWIDNPTIGSSIMHFMEAEFLARITALFTSIFAIVDASSHLLIGMCKKDASEVTEHFKQAQHFFWIALLGSILGAVWPEELIKLRSAPSMEGYAEKIQALALAVEEGRECAPFYRLQYFWRHQSNLEAKALFVNTFNQDKNGFSLVRKVLAEMVYKPIHPQQRQVRWLSKQLSPEGESF